MAETTNAAGFLSIIDNIFDFDSMIQKLTSNALAECFSFRCLQSDGYIRLDAGFKCVICNCNKVDCDSIACMNPKQKHKICIECFNQYVELNCSKKNTAKLISNKYRIACPVCPSGPGDNKHLFKKGAIKDYCSLKVSSAFEAAEAFAKASHKMKTKDGSVYDDQKPFTCQSCLHENFSIWEGVPCERSSGRHWLCEQCFNQAVLFQINDIGSFSDNGREIVCPFCITEKTKIVAPYSHKIINSRCETDVFEQYTKTLTAAKDHIAASSARARELSLEKKKAELALKNEIIKNENNEIARLKSLASLHRMKIIDNILTQKCPSCSLVFHDWSNCFAIKCEFKNANDEYISGCRSHFCGWCLQNGFANNTECHNHVKNCKFKLGNKNFDGIAGRSNIDQHNEVQAPIKRKKIEDYLASQNLTGRERQAIIDMMQESDLTPLGIFDLK